MIVTILALILIKFLKDQRYIQLILSPKYLLYLIVTITAITLLGMRKVSNLVRIITLIILFFIFGVFIDIHPSPLCALTKSFTRYQMVGFIPLPMIIMAGAMILFTIIGNKIFCGWICPLACLQEVIFTLSKIIRKIKFPFLFTNSIRFLLIAIFFLFVFLFRVNIYNLFNPFEFFHWDFQGYTTVVISIVILASLFYYRPFCQFICPAGLITWIFEHASIFRIHIKKVATRKSLTKLVMIKGKMTFLMILDNLKMTSCKHPKGQIQSQKILFPIMVKRIIAPAITIIGGEINPLI